MFLLQVSPAQWPKGDPLRCTVLRYSLRDIYKVRRNERIYVFALQLYQPRVSSFSTRLEQFKVKAGGNESNQQRGNRQKNKDS